MDTFSCGKNLRNLFGFKVFKSTDFVDAAADGRFAANLSLEKRHVAGIRLSPLQSCLSHLKWKQAE